MCCICKPQALALTKGAIEREAVDGVHCCIYYAFLTSYYKVLNTFTNK